MRTKHNFDPRADFPLTVPLPYITKVTKSNVKRGTSNKLTKNRESKTRDESVSGTNNIFMLSRIH